VDHAFVKGWLHDLERALHAACTPEGDPRWRDTLAALLDHHHARWQTHAVRERLPRYARLADADPAHRWRARMLQALLADADPRPALDDLWADVPRGAPRRRVVQEAAWYALERGDLDDASAWLERVDDHDDALLLELGSELERRRGRLPRALELAERAAARVRDAEPLSSSIWSHLGDLRRDAGRRPEAAAAYRRSLRLAQDRGDDRQVAVVELNLLLLRLGAGTLVPRAEILAVRRALRGGSRDATLASDLLGLLVVAEDDLPAAVASLLPRLPSDHPELRSIAQVVHTARRHRALAAVVAALSPST
jgi:tetratricopeptide (TPR) repeat protein